MSVIVKKIKQDFRRLADPGQEALLSGFFKTGPGEYAEGDRFYGIKVPETRKLVKKYKDDLGLKEIVYLLHSPMHEERLFALLALIDKFKKGDEVMRKTIFGIYLKNTEYINNWDLVDLTAPHIVGAWLGESCKIPPGPPLRKRGERDSEIIRTLDKLAVSKLLWDRRIAMISTFHFIMLGRPEYTFYLADRLLDDRHDLMHKAVGWMLREVGKRCSMNILEEFLQTRYQRMPRTMLRYAIERFPEKRRQDYLKGRI